MLKNVKKCRKSGNETLDKNSSIIYILIINELHTQIKGKSKISLKKSYPLLDRGKAHSEIKPLSSIPGCITAIIIHHPEEVTGNTALDSLIRSFHLRIIHHLGNDSEENIIPVRLVVEIARDLNKARY